MRIIVEGRDLPGRSFAEHGNVHIALQDGKEPVGAVPGDAASARWDLEVRVVDGDFRGTPVHGRRGERFLYLMWGSPTGPGIAGWGGFRRAKLMLNRIDPAVVAAADRDGQVLLGKISLTDDCGGPRCARVDPPALAWTVVPGRPRVT